MADNKNSSGPRQAVVLIHGIGEQRPMETLRAFVAAFLERALLPVLKAANTG